MNNKNKQFIFYAIVFFGIFLRLFKLNYPGITVDEYITSNFCSGKNLLYLIFDTLANNPHPPLFFILEYIITAIFGISEISIRILPALFSIISIFVFYKFVRSFFSEKISFIALFLFCFNPYLIYYSHDARMYPFFLLVSILIIYYFLMSIKYNSFLFVPFIFWSIIGLYVHNYTFNLLLILNFLVFLKYYEEIRLNQWIKANIIIFLFWVPLIPFYIKSVLGDAYSLKVGLLLAPFYTIKNFIFGLTINFNLFIIVAFIFITFLIFNAIITNRDKTKKQINLLVEISLLFIAIPWIESIILTPVYSDRTLIIIVPYIIILVSIGASYLSKNGLTIFLLIIVFIYAISNYNFFYNKDFQNINYGEQFDFLLNKIDDSDVIIHTNTSSYAAYEFYNKLKYKKNFENRLLQEIPEFKGGKLKFIVRDMWRRFNDFLKKYFDIYVYSGYDKNILPEKELYEKIKDIKRIWLVVDNENGIQRICLPFGNVWYSKTKIKDVPVVENIDWVKKFFNIKEKKDFYGTSIYLLEKK